ncbi:uncharacterized protein LOC133192174 isoform X2 [Saccostrea echinata]|uniref:uncharacterized protein LOC133192174 isoform X2 n=1 Tax=Saccostrea echinata TaxID=191078 RepID=UPI002A8250EB|nr:uncharacterized protein LOC133192174 isoform X2 [Saccostrea echinata]
MDPLRLKSGLPTQHSYYYKLIKSGRITGKARNKTDYTPSTEPNVHDDIECENPFITTSVSPGLELPGENREKIKAKNYAMRSKSLQDLKNARRETGHISHHGNGMDSEYLQNLYKKYPHTFQRRNPKDSRRPSRQMFNSRLHVHFDDEVHYDDDVRSVSSERPAVTKYDREMERIFGHHRHPRSCLTSPTPSLILDSTERHREHVRLPPKTKSYTLPNRPMHHEGNGEVSGPLKFQRASQSESDYGSDRIKLLELELERKEKQIQSYRRRLEFQQHIPHSTNGTLSDSSHWRVLSPDSPPDSAIDVDSSSVQSSNLGPSHLSPRNDHLPYHTGQLNQEFSPKERKYGSTDHLNQMSIGGYLQHRHMQNGNLVQNNNKDSDVDSGIAQSLTRMRFDKGIRDLRNGTSVWDSTHLHHRPMSAVEFGHTRHALDKFEFLKDSRTSRRKDSDDDSIIQEIQHHPVMTEYQFRAVNQQQEEEVDDSDPSFGLPTITEDDTFVREIYQQRKKPTPYKIVQRCLTARPNSAPTWKNCASESHVSVLCTPRRNEKSWKFSAISPREEETENVQTFKSKSESHLHGKSDARSFFHDDDQFKFSPKIEEKIQRHSRKLSQLSDSDLSETTLISSQIALSENHLIGAHYGDHKEIPLSLETPHNFNPKERVTDNSFAKPGFKEPLSKVQFRKDLKLTDLNDDILGHMGDSDTTNSGLSEPERLTPYEASVIKMDQQGLDVEDLIESDSDNVFAKPLVLNKIPKSEHREKELRTKSPERVISSHVTVSRESSASVPESENTDPASGSSELSAESDNNQGDGNAASPSAEDMYDPQDPDYATVMCSPVDGMNQLTISDPVQEMTKEKPDTSHHIYAKVKHVNRKTDTSDSEQEKGKFSSPDEEIRLHGNGTNNSESYVVGPGTKLSRKVSQSTPNVAETSTYNSNQEVPPLPDRNYGSTTNLAKSKELSGSRISLSNKMSNLRAAAKSKFKTLRKAVSLDKGINKTQGEFRPEDLSADMPPQGKPPKAKKGRSLKKLFGRKSSKHRSTEISNHGTETSDKVMVTGHCSSIESRKSEDEISISQLREVLPDGTQIVELNRRHKGPIGFYIARGSTQFKHGIFVSRFSEEVDADERFAGLLNVGDEILEVNGHNISDASLDDVYDLMADQSLEVKILPLLSRKDIHEQSTC